MGLISLINVKMVDGFSLPGVQMTSYKKGDELPLFVNSLTSSDTLLPLDYYKLPFCRVREEKKKSTIKYILPPFSFL
jgi:transmembrane 9 superfamily protein 2/4